MNMPGAADEFLHSKEMLTPPYVEFSSDNMGKCDFMVIHQDYESFQDLRKSMMLRNTKPKADPLTCRSYLLNLAPDAAALVFEVLRRNCPTYLDSCEPLLTMFVLILGERGVLYNWTTKILPPLIPS